MMCVYRGMLKLDVMIVLFIHESITCEWGIGGLEAVLVDSKETRTACWVVFILLLQ